VSFAVSRGRARATCASAAMNAALREGADVNFMGVGESPLHAAAARNDPYAATLLLDRGARELQDAKGNTPAHVAAKHGAVAMMRLLLERGSDPFLRNVSVGMCVAIAGERRLLSARGCEHCMWR
jgi:ankyrin repeat protein